MAQGDRVLEIGPGLGSLTLALAAAGASIVALELDKRLAALLPATVEGLDVAVVQGDAMTVDWEELLAPPGGDASPRPAWSIVANLPYNVATPVVLRSLEEADRVERWTVMVQREVGERWVARAGDAGFGAVSVKMAWWAEARLVGSVPAAVFTPQPKVESVLVSLKRRTPPTVDREVAFGLLEAGFATRRKMLRRNLVDRVVAEQFEAAGIAPTQRAEELDLEDWIRLAEVVGADGVSS